MQTAQCNHLDAVIGAAVAHVSLSKTEVRAWRMWWPNAMVFDILLIRKRNGGLLHTVVNNTYPNGSTAA